MRNAEWTTKNSAKYSIVWVYCKKYDELCSKDYTYSSSWSTSFEIIEVIATVVTHCKFASHNNISIQLNNFSLANRGKSTTCQTYTCMQRINSRFLNEKLECSKYRPHRISLITVTITSTLEEFKNPDEFTELQSKWHTIESMVGLSVYVLITPITLTKCMIPSYHLIYEITQCSTNENNHTESGNLLQPQSIGGTIKTCQRKS